MSTVVEIDGVDIRSAGVLNRDCAFPITNLSKRCPGDQIFQNMPIYFGGWPDGTVAPAITAVRHEITDQASCAPCVPDGCRNPVVKTVIDACEMFAPNMRCIGLDTQVIEWRDLLTHFCRQRGLARNEVTIFGPNGELDYARPWALDMVRFALKGVWDALGRLVVDTVVNGDYSSPWQIDGILNQIENGWSPVAGNACADEFNKATVIDWAVLTGLAEPTADDVTIAGQTIDVWGVTLDVPEGLNLAEFLDDMWIEKIRTEGVCRGDITDWEAFTAWGQSKCLASTAACMRPCDGCDDDPAARQRLKDFRMMRHVELYPSGVEFDMKESRAVEPNTLWFGPRTIDNNPTYALFVDAIDNYLTMLPNDPFDRIARMDMMSDGMPGICENNWRTEIEERGVFIDLHRVGDTCVQGTTKICIGALATARHLWLKVENLYCPTLIGACESPVTVG
ncbi:MAG: hypothetical protein KF832_31250 [Caldilineaceae bacterium]|nr:hypothetical protein [Caldilineaceae bacterium]